MKAEKTVSLCGIWPNVFRALEIAKLGNHTVSIHFSKDYTNGFRDYKAIKKFCEGWFENFVVEGEIKLEIVKPMSYEPHPRCENLQECDIRVTTALWWPEPKAGISDASRQLLKVASEKLNLSLSQIDTIYAVSSTIAKLDHSDTIKIEHLAEAIQYSTIIQENSLNGEEESITFGGMITVKLGDIDPKDVQEAINYLKTLL